MPNILQPDDKENKLLCKFLYNSGQLWHRMAVFLSLFLFFGTISLFWGTCIKWSTCIKQEFSLF